MSVQNPIHIGSVIRNAVLFNLKNHSGDAVNTDSPLEAVARLFNLLEERKIDYVLVGGVAMLSYVQGRNTEDIDLIMALSSLEKLPEIEILHKDVYFLRGQFEELKIDILLTKNPLFKKIRRKYTALQNFQERPIPSATVDGLLLLKLYALPSLYRQGNFVKVGLYENDIATLMYEYEPNIEALMAELRQHLNETDLIALQEILGEIGLRIERFRKRLGSAGSSPSH